MTCGKTMSLRPGARRFFAAAGFSLMLLAGVLPCARAQEAAPGATRQPPAAQDQPRRDYQMGTTQGNILIDRDQQGDSVIEVTPKPPKQVQPQTNIGPIIVVPKVNQK